MAISVNLEQSPNATVITLAGELDTPAAMLLEEQVARVVADRPQRLVLMVQDLQYIASAGLRVLVFAKQKMGPGVDLYIIGAQQQVLDTLQKTGFDRSCILQDAYA